MYIPRFVSVLLEKLNDDGYKAYVVGGCVRDSLLRITPHDYDIATDALPEQIKTSFASYKTIDTGIKHGTVAVLSEGEQVEITTFRIDGEYSDNRHPDSVSFTRDIKDDLSRRDFTVNAMAYNDADGLTDCFGGERDLENKLIRAVGDPDLRFREDGLRILRALRFAAVYGFTVEKETADAVHRNRNLLKNIAGERIACELNKFICAPCADILREFVDVFSVIIPELAATVGFEQHNKYHNRTVFEHTLATIEAIKPDKVLRLTMLFHDLGKPECFTMVNGTGHCKGHAEVSVKIAQRVLSALRYDRETKEAVVSLVKYHDYPIDNNKKIVRRRLYKFGGEMFFRLIDIHIADNEGKKENLAFRKDIFLEAKEIAEDIIRENECFSLAQLDINGNDIVNAGYMGRTIGFALDFLLAAVIDEKCENEKQELLKYLEMYGNI